MDVLPFVCLKQSFADRNRFLCISKTFLYAEGCFSITETTFCMLGTGLTRLYREW